MTLACEDANSKLVEAVSVADVDAEDNVGNSLLQIWELMFGPKARLKICQKFYTTIFLDRNFYTIKTRTSGLFSPTVNQRKCINISYLVLFCVKIYMNV